MNCYLHSDVPALAYCRTCGRPLCTVCQRPAEGTVFCQEHVPITANASQGEAFGASAGASAAASAASNPYVQPPAAPPPLPVQTSPGLAFLLGLIPGVGAIYNGQYLKGLIHAVIFGVLLSLANAADNTSGEPFLVMLAIGFYCYMPFEAYHTAKRRQMGIRVEEWSSLLPQSRYMGRAPIGPILLIVIGVVFLLDSLHLIEFREIGRFWPVILILIGAYMLYNRVTAPAQAPPVSPPPTGQSQTRSDSGVFEAHNEQ